MLHVIQTVGWTRGAVLLAAALVLSALAVGGAARVLAHARYDHSTPADGEVVQGSPPRVDAYFGEEMRRAGGLPTMIVVNQSGDVVASEPALDDADRKHISVELPPALPNGRYTVIWHNLSDEDGEEAQGAFAFTITGSGTPGPEASGTGAPSATPSAAPATSKPAATTAPAGMSEDSDSDVPVWALIAGIAGGVVIGGGAGLVAGRRSGGG